LPVWGFLITKDNLTLKNLNSLNDLVWGNPCKEDVENISHATYLDDLLPSFMNNVQPPLNTSQEAIAELYDLMELQKRRQISRKSLFDKMLVPVIVDLYARNGVQPEPVQKLGDDIVQDILPVITKLKYHYNRPRPNQLAYYHGLDLNPDFSNWVSSPSYPSGHATLCMVMGHVLRNAYPQSFDVMHNFMREVLWSRLEMGVHYESDNVAAKILSEQIVIHDQFKTKYHI